MQSFQANDQSRVGLASNSTCVLLRRQPYEDRYARRGDEVKTHGQEEVWPGDRGGRDQSGVSTSQGMPRMGSNRRS